MIVVSRLFTKFCQNTSPISGFTIISNNNSVKGVTDNFHKHQWIFHLNRYYRRNSFKPIKNVSYKQSASRILPQKKWKTFVKRIAAVPERSIKHLWIAFAFTIGVSTVSYMIASVAQYEYIRNYSRSFMSKFSPSSFDEMFDNQFNFINGVKLTYMLIAVNTIVFLLWQVKAFKPFMWKWFTNSFASDALCMPMILSVFSHSSLLHFFFNMYVLNSFAGVAIDKFFGIFQFSAFYISAAVFSSFVSLAHKCLIRSPVPSLGASGAILALLVYVCCKMPDSHVRVIFVPWITFPAQYATIGLIIMDTAGLLFRFRLFDHAAHLGGSLFGLFYALYGDGFWESFGSKVVDVYRQMRFRVK